MLNAELFHREKLRRKQIWIRELETTIHNLVEDLKIHEQLELESHVNAKRHYKSSEKYPSRKDYHGNSGELSELDKVSI